MIRILHSVSNMDRGGIETMLMNYYRNIDRTKVQFDFLCNKKKAGDYDEEILNMGGRIFRTPGLSPLKYLDYLKYMKNLFLENPEYSIIEVHNGALGVYALNAAKRNGISVRIFHAHSTRIPKDFKSPLKVICKNLLKYNINTRFSCGVVAAQFFFGNKGYELVTNAVDLDKFSFNKEKRIQLKKQFSLEGKLVLGHVGRFAEQKNHTFLIDVFREVYKQNKSAVLVLIGTGYLENQIKSKVKSYELENCVYFIGNIGNVHEWYSVFDILLLPSLWEGLPVVGVEAQSAGLKCIFSDTVTKEIGLDDDSIFEPINDATTWANKILIILGNLTERKSKVELITEKGYNIKKEAIILQNRYIELFEGIKK